jgi:two-component system cell cycle sensor histidine kinase/response regulator CckA
MTAIDQSELGRALFEEIGDALFLLEPDTDRLVEANPVALRLTGFARDEILQFPASYLFRFESPGGAQRLKAAIQKTMVFHSQDGFLLRSRADEQWVPVNLTVSRLHGLAAPLALIIARDDRERRAAFAQVRRVEGELRKVLSSSPAALWSAERAAGPDVTAGWQFRYVSPLLARLAGRPAEFFDHPFRWSEVVHPQDRDRHRTDLRNLLCGREAEAEWVYRVQAVGGAVRWVRERLQVVRDTSARPTRLDGCLADITEQLQAEEALRQSERRFRALVEKSRDGIFLLDEAGVVRYASPAVHAVLGHDADALAGQDWSALVHPDDRAAFQKQFALALARPGEDLAWRFRAVPPGGGVRVIETNACNRLDDPSVRAVVLNYRDVTERELAAEELARQHSLKSGLFASIADVVCYKDRELRFLGGNPAFEALAGRPIADIIGTTCDDLFRDEWADRLRAAEAHVLSTGETLRSREWVNYPDGRRALLDIVLTPLRVGGGEAHGLIIAGRDVTEQARLEDELRQAAKMEAVGRLAGGIAHDFNNLLTVILGNLELLRGGATPDDSRELIATTERAARHAADLTKQMLGFARRQPVKATAVDLNALVRDTVGLFRRSFDPRIVFEMKLAPDLRPVSADAGQLQQVVVNLCLNARDAMPDGGTLTLETAAAGDATAEFVRLSVGDTGVGMTEDVRAKIFDPFFTTKEIGQGTGLGLAVVYGAARAHGGWVECASSPGRGSRFDVFLPRGEVTPPEAVPHAAAVPRGRGETILVADDEVGVRELARITLTRHGYQVLTARDGADAVEVYRRERGRVALVFLDMGMPNLSGSQARDAIRAIDAHVPVLFASGNPPPETDTDDNFLHKPYAAAQLAAAVRRILDRTPVG